MTWCWIIPIIVGLITAILGYLLGRSGKQQEIDEWRDKYEQEKERAEEIQRKVYLLENDIASARQSEQKATNAYEELIGRFELLQKEWDDNRTENQNLRDEIAELKKQRDGGEEGEGTAIPLMGETTTPIFDAEGAKAVFGKTIRQDDLTIIEGIGPKIQELFHDNGIRTWYDLSQCSIEQCELVLRSGGDRFNQHTPVTWPRQAALAYEGRWAELKAWQDELDGGK